MSKSDTTRRPRQGATVGAPADNAVPTLALPAPRAAPERRFSHGYKARYFGRPLAHRRAEL